MAVRPDSTGGWHSEQTIFPGAFSIGQEETTMGSPTENRRNIPERSKKMALFDKKSVKMYNITRNRIYLDTQFILFFWIVKRGVSWSHTFRTSPPNKPFREGNRV